MHSQLLHMAKTQSLTIIITLLMNDDIQDLICMWVNDKQGWDVPDKKKRGIFF